MAKDNVATLGENTGKASNKKAASRRPQTIYVTYGVDDKGEVVVNDVYKKADDMLVALDDDSSLKFLRIEIPTGR